MKTLVVAVTVILGVLLVSGPLLAHHGEANYDTTKVVSVKGTVTDFLFVNPHVQIALDVKNDKGEIEKWIGESTCFLSLHRPKSPGIALCGITASCAELS